MLSNICFIDAFWSNLPPPSLKYKLLDSLVYFRRYLEMFMLLSLLEDCQEVGDMDDIEGS